jgi:hypothetical protein
LDGGFFGSSLWTKCVDQCFSQRRESGDISE